TPPSSRSSLFATGLRFGLLTSAAVTGLSLLVGGVLEPLHARGHLQSLTGFVNGLDHILQMFGTKAAYFAGFIPGHHLTSEAWYFSRGVSLLLWFVAGFWLGTIWYR